jgi:nitroreductase
MEDVQGKIGLLNSEARMPPALTPLLATRYSCRSYKPLPLATEILQSLFEAARWSPSSYNEQPWSFIVAQRQDSEAFERMLGCVGGNRDWCQNASVLLACCTARSFKRNNKPNRLAWHDLGLAVMSMAVQGMSLGLQMREMAGIEPDKIREIYKVPETHDVASGLAIGFPAEGMPEGRSRKEQVEFVFEGAWGRSLG